MASGNYVVGRDIDFQFGEPSSSATSEAPSSQHYTRDPSAARQKSKKTAKSKLNDAVCHREGGASVAPKKQHNGSDALYSKLPQVAKAKREVQNVPATALKPSSNSSGESMNSRGSSSGTSSASSMQASSNLKRPAKPSKPPKTSRLDVSAAVGKKLRKQQSRKLLKRKAPLSAPAKGDQDQRGTTGRGQAPSQMSGDSDVWYSSSSEERNRLLEFWRQLSTEEKSNLASVDKNALFNLIHYERRSCSCPVCDDKREAVDEELEELFTINELRLTKYAEALQNKDTIFIESGLDNGIREYFQRTINKSTKELNWIQPDFHSVLRDHYIKDLEDPEELPSSNKGLFQELLENPLSDLNLSGISSLASLSRDYSEPPSFRKLPEGAPSDLDLSAFPPPMAHLCTALMEIIYGEPRPDLSPGQSEKTKEFEARVLSRLRIMSSAASKSDDPDAQARLSKNFLQIWTEMLLIYQSDRPCKRMSPSGPRTLTEAEVREYARDLAKPILNSNDDEIPSNTVKAVMSIGPLCDSQGIDYDDQRKIFMEMLQVGLSGRYPRMVQALFAEFVQDVDHNNGSNLLQMLENLPPDELPLTPSTTQISAETSADNNETRNGLVKYYEHVNGNADASYGFDLEVNIADSVAPSDSLDGSDSRPRVDKLPRVTAYSGEDDTDDELGDETDTKDSHTFDTEDEDDYAFSADEDSFEGDESCITEDIAVLEQQEAKRLLQASYYLHYLFARLLEQRVLKAYREHVAKQRQLSLLAELAEEEAKAVLEANRRQREKDKKKSKKLILKQLRDEEAERKAIEAKRKAEKAEAARAKEAARRLQQIEQDRAKQEAHRRKIEERMAQLAIESKAEVKTVPSDGKTNFSPQNVAPRAHASEPFNASQKSQGAITAAQSANKKLKGKAEKAKPEKPHANDISKPLERAKIQEKNKAIEKYKPVEKPKHTEKLRIDKLKPKSGDKSDQGKVKAPNNVDRSNFEEKPKRSDAEASIYGDTNLSAGKTLSDEIMAEASSSKIPHVLAERETINCPCQQSSTSWLQSQGVIPYSGPSLQQIKPAKDSSFPSVAPSSIMAPPGIETLNPIAPAESIGDISGLPSNLGGGPFGPSIASKLAVDPPPGMGAYPLQKTVGMGLGSNLVSPKIDSSGLLGSALNGGVGSRIIGPVYPGFSMNALNNSSDAPPPLVTANVTGVGKNIDGMNMYRRQLQQPQQPSQPHPLPQYSSVSSLWSLSGSALPQVASANWQRSPWNDDRSSESAKLAQAGPPSLWKNASSSTFAKQASAIDILEAIQRCYRDIQGLGVDGYVPSQVLYHAVQSHSGLRFNQNELYKACSRLPSFNCIRDDVGLITHIKL